MSSAPQLDMVSNYPTPWQFCFAKHHQAVFEKDWIPWELSGPERPVVTVGNNNCIN
jgi:hypothetical protein